MATKKQRHPWQDRWVQVDRTLGEGGQGKVFVVKKACDTDSDERFALKELKNHKCMERRGRMHREVAALESLRHPGIPRCLDSNASQFADPEVYLYLVTEYIPGPTLEEYVKTTTVEPATALDCTLKLLEIIGDCHQRNVIHRDVKPENIILRDSDPLRPVLLDFGLSFNQGQDSDFLTYPGQELGNRFLHLPELQHPGPGQRDGRADITQCCGILFYLITGAIPRTLRDQDGKKPHERDQSLLTLKRLERDQRDCLFAVFERGFEHEIGRRFQTVDELRLILVDSMTPSGGEAEARKIRIIRAAIGLNETHQRNKAYIVLLEQVACLIKEVCQEIAEELFGGECAILDESEVLDVANLRLDMKRGLAHRGHPEKAFAPRFIAAISQSQLRLHTIEESGRSATIFIAPIEAAMDWVKCKEGVRRLFVDRVGEAFSGRTMTRLIHALPEPGITPMSRSELSAQLHQLPLRAIVAFAARCARRVEFLVSEKDVANSPSVIASIGAAIASAEGYAGGDATSACGEAASNAMAASSAMLGLKENAGQPDFRLGDVALAASDAACAALFARQNDGDGTINCALAAYRHACSAHLPSHLFATFDLRRLLIAGLGQFPQLGFPIDPGDSGPLGPYSP